MTHILQYMFVLNEKLVNVLNTYRYLLFKCSYFAEMHNGKARQIHGHSQHPTKGLVILLTLQYYTYILFSTCRYPLAITSINMTSILYNMVMDNTLEYYFYLSTEGRVVTIADFMETHCKIICQ